MQLDGMHAAARSGDYAEVKRYLDRGFDANLRGPGETTPLHWAVSWGRDDVAMLLMEHGADPSLTDDEGETPLYLGARKGYTETTVVEALLAHPKTDVNAANDTGWTALHGASLRGREDMVKLLLLAGAEPTLRTKGGETAADLARRKGHERIAALLEESASAA